MRLATPLHSKKNGNRNASDSDDRDLCQLNFECHSFRLRVFGENSHTSTAIALAFMLTVPYVSDLCLSPALRL